MPLKRAHTPAGIPEQQGHNDIEYLFMESMHNQNTMPSEVITDIPFF